MAPDDPEQLDRLFTVAYEELRRLANTVRRGESSETLSPTALIHEAWLKLSRAPGLHIESDLHFRRIAARAMRQVLVEAARHRKAEKRGGSTSVMVTLDERMASRAATADDVLALDAALKDLETLHPRQAALVESRFFAGFDVATTADLLGISEATALRDWRAARAWLGARLGGEA